MDILFVGTVGDFSVVHGGYGTASQGMLFVLQSMLKYDDKVDYITSIDYIDTLNFNAIKIPEKNYDIVFLHTHPNSFNIQNTADIFKKILSLGKRRFLSVVWETEPLPSTWNFLWNSDLFTGFISPSKFVANQIVKNTKKPVYYVPHYININSYNKIDIDEKIKNEDIFTVLFLGQYTARKGIHEALLSYIRALHPFENTQLILKYHLMSDKEIPMDTMIKYYINTNCSFWKSKIFILTDEMSLGDMEELYQNSSLLLFPSRGEGFGLPCHPGGTALYTRKGLYAIEDMSENDIVYTHTGKEQRVSGTTERYYNGKMIEFVPRGSEPIESTEDHPWYVVPTYGKRFTTLDTSKLTPVWVNAQNIQEGDLFTIPRVRFGNDISTIRITEKVDGLVTKDGKVSFPMSYVKNGEISYKTIADRFGCHERTIHKALHCLRDSELMTNIREYCHEIGYTHPKAIELPEYLQLSEDIMYLFGLYIAEGSIVSKGNAIEFSLHTKEEYLSDDIESIVADLCPDITVGHHIRGNRRRVVVSSKVLAQLFSSIFGKGAKNKSIPWWIMNSANTDALLRGYFTGDGHLPTKSTSATTASKQLAYDISLLLNKHGMYAPVAERIRSDKDLITTEYVVRIYRQDFKVFRERIGIGQNPHISKSGRKAYYYLSDQEYFYVPVMRVSSYMFSGSVYNLHVENDESYLVCGFSSHNCAEAMSAGIPVIYTNWSSCPEVAEAPGNIAINYTLDEAYNMSNYGYEYGSKYAYPNIEDLTNAIRDKYNKWKFSKREYYEEVMLNRSLVDNKFGYEAIKNYFSYVINNVQEKRIIL